MHAVGQPSMLHPEGEVIQEISHGEPAAARDDEAASLAVGTQTHEDFAAFVERRIREDGQTEYAQPSNKVHLVSFRSGDGKLFRTMLLKDREFRPLRKSLMDARFPMLLPSGTIVLVRPDQYLDTVNSPTLQSHALKRYNVIIAESEEYLMDEVLLRMASKRRPRENRLERAELDLAADFVTQRAFLCEAPKLLMAGTVAQSTTEAVRSTSSASASYFAHHRGVNPRRRALGHWDD